jgi:hypothetical protein
MRFAERSDSAAARKRAYSSSVASGATENDLSTLRTREQREHLCRDGTVRTPRKQAHAAYAPAGDAVRTCEHHASVGIAHDALVLDVRVHGSCSHTREPQRRALAAACRELAAQVVIDAV